jgi:hypothetical protein
MLTFFAVVGLALVIVALLNVAVAIVIHCDILEYLVFGSGAVELLGKAIAGCFLVDCRADRQQQQRLTGQTTARS